MGTEPDSDDPTLEPPDLEEVPVADERPPARRKRGRPRKSAEAKASKEKEPKRKISEELPPEILEMVGRAPLLISSIVAHSVMRKQLIYDKHALRAVDISFRHWIDSTKAKALSPGWQLTLAYVAALGSGIARASDVAAPPEEPRNDIGAGAPASPAPHA